MHVLHVIDSLSVGGAERMLVEIANKTAAAGHRVSVCITRSERTLAAALAPGIELTVLDRQKRIDMKAMRRFAALVNSGQVDVLHVHGRTSFSFVALTQFARLCRKPIVLHDHNSIELDDSVPRWFRPCATRFVAQYVGVYERLVDWAAGAGVPRERIHVIFNTLDLGRVHDAAPYDLRTELKVGPEVQVGIAVGGLRREKAIDVLLDAVAQSTQRKSFVIALIGGDRDAAYAQSCREQAAALGLEATVAFLGERDNVPSLIRGADFAVLSSRSESGPLVLIEYLAGALPVVATRVGSIGKQAESLGVTEFVAPDDAQALADAIDRLVSLSPAQRQARSQAGFEVASRHFDILQALPRWYEIYQTAMETAKK